MGPSDVGGHNPEPPERQRRGISLGGAFDRRDGGSGWEVRGEHLDAIAEAGFTLVRLPVRWVDEGTGLLPAVDAVVRAAWARGLGVALTNHHDDEALADPAPLGELWQGLAEHFLRDEGPLSFELLNEPRMSAEEWNALLPSVLAAVREVDPSRAVVVGGVDLSSVAGLLQLELPPDEHLIATVHYYEPFRFTHQGAHWEPGADAWLGTRWGTDADHEAVTTDLIRAQAWARDRGVPLFVGEFGTYQAADCASRLRWTTWVRHELERLEIPWAYWDFATDFGAYDLDRGEWDDELLNGLVG